MKRPRSFARTFGQDLMRGEHVVGGGKVKKADAVPGSNAGENSGATKYTRGRKHTVSLKGGLTHRTTADPYLEEKKLKSLNINTQEWVQSKIADGDIEGGMSAGQTGTSIFDPVLCELAYRWFCPPGGVVLDPFAGGSVRGVVASKLGRRYVGLDLRIEQITANRQQAQTICVPPADPMPEWICGDSRLITTLAAGVDADFVFSCPPYADLEVYSDDPADLSTLDYAEFRDAYATIIGATCSMLKPDRFACFVVGEARGKDGNYYGFVPDTIRSFVDASLGFYNEAILVTAAGSLPIRAGKQFAASRKLGKTHQNILVFVKGDTRKAVAAIGEVEFADPVAAMMAADGDVTVIGTPQSPAGPMSGVTEL